jgi:putative ATP-grasp target RiPP
VIRWPPRVTGFRLARHLSSGPSLTTSRARWGPAHSRCGACVVAAPKAGIGPDVIYVYDPERQITLVRDAHGEVVPLSKHTKPGATPSSGTSETRDSDGNPPPAEEMLPPDYQQD